MENAKKQAEAVFTVRQMKVAGGSKQTGIKKASEEAFYMGNRYNQLLADLVDGVETTFLVHNDTAVGNFVAPFGSTAQAA